MRRVVVVGGSVGGVHAAEALRDQGFEGEVTLVSADAQLPYDRPPLSKDVLLGKTDADRILLRPAGWYEERDIDLRLGNAARGLDAASKTLSLADGSELGYDGLVLATGSAARTLTLPEGSPEVHVVRTLEDVEGLRPELQPGRRLVMIGAGFIGLEIAAVAVQLGLEVTVLEYAPSPLARVFGGEVGGWYRGLHERNGVRMICGVSITGTEPAPGGVTMTLDNGETVTAEVVVAGIGAAPAIEWLAGSGVELGNGVLCSPDLRTSAPDVVAVGDIANWRNAAFDEEMRVEHWTNASEQGRHAVTTLLGDSAPFSSVPYFWTDQYDTKLRFVGRAAGFTDSRIESMTDDKLVVTIGRDGVLIGALCLGAPRHLARYKAAIQAKTPWHDSAALAEGLPA
ncbi:MAG: NAD(P)/FAD-dependent oxidoreductase [Candidatus Leucobacter sulfamidivorax]|nr:NAD(P)/FAD-dependent oxidoreductase [Candidatus Leucobacter sulfamidivorax]